MRRQAVVIVHGMGEQRPGDTLNGFINAGLALDGPVSRRFYYSRPDTVSDSFEARRFLSPRSGERPQTEFFEYHWAHLMQGNRLDDLWPTFRRMLLTDPRRVPSGLLLVWVLFWLLIVGAAWATIWGPLSGLPIIADGPAVVLQALVGAGATAALLSYLASRVLAPGITKSFVDVVRYLDTSPRSYEVRRQIRKGFIDLLTNLHDRTLSGKPRYQRIIIVAHSLGSYIAYDGISYLWGQMNHKTSGKAGLDGLAEVEQAAADLPESPRRPAGGQPATELAGYRAAQRRLWQGLRDCRNPWRITDLVTVGSPMYFADRLYTRNRSSFRQKMRRGELPTCPPIPDPDPQPAPDRELARDPQVVEEAMATDTTIPRFTWRWKRRVLHESAPFAVVRWTNLWFPHRFGLGDWFGGPLSRLYGRGIQDVEVRGNTRGRWGWLSGRTIPGLAHTRYFNFPDDTTPGSVTSALQDALDLRLETFPHAPSESTAST